MADRVILTPGVVPPDLVMVAMMLLRKGGTCVLTGHAEDHRPDGADDLHGLGQLMQDAQGVLYGETEPARGDAEAAVDVRVGPIKLDELITKKYKLDDINEAMKNFAPA